MMIPVFSPRVSGRRRVPLLPPSAPALLLEIIISGDICLSRGASGQRYDCVRNTRGRALLPALPVLPAARAACCRAPGTRVKSGHLPSELALTVASSPGAGADCGVLGRAAQPGKRRPGEGQVQRSARDLPATDCSHLPGPLQGCVFTFFISNSFQS